MMLVKRMALAIGLLCVFLASQIIAQNQESKMGRQTKPKTNSSTAIFDSGSPVIGAQAITQAINTPSKVATDTTGGFYFSSMLQNRIYKVAADGSLSLAAGVGSSGFSGDGGPATAAQLKIPSGIAVDSTGNLYIVDTRNQRIRKVTSAGIITTVAGNGTQGFSGDRGPATAAQLKNPYGVAVDSEGSLYFADTFNNRIRKVLTSGIIITVAGNGTQGCSGDEGPATAAQLSRPFGIAVDSAGNLYIADRENDRIREVSKAGIITTVAGIGPNGGQLYRVNRFSGDEGLATAAHLSRPNDVAVDSAGNLFIADTGNNRIRKVTSAGIITTVAGNGDFDSSGDGGQATAAQVKNPMSVAVDSVGSLYILDAYRIRKVLTSGIIITVAGNGTNGSSGRGGDREKAIR
jgi:sugar lactone lactonase YvrE